MTEQTQTGGAIVPRGDMVLRSELSQDKVELISRTIAQGATKDELGLFIAICNRTGLDPFLRQIYLIPSYDRTSGRTVRRPAVSIDGMRLNAQRTGEYAGQSPAQWCGADGRWTDVWLESDPPVAARVGVYRRGFVEALTSIALWREYCPMKDGRPTGQWPKMPALMLAKCAEALALRKAFPAELSGLYTAEEMAQASNDAPLQNPPPMPREQSVEELLSPVPSASRAVEPMQADRKQDAPPDPEVQEVELLAIPKDAVIEVVKNDKGTRVWKIEHHSLPEPLAALDQKLATTIEANCAFGLTTEVQVKRSAKGRLVVVETLRDWKEKS